MTAQHFEFAGRLSRIEAGQGSFKSTLFVGPEDAHRVTYRERGQKSGRKSRFGFLRKLVMLPLGIALAVVADMAARIGIFSSNLPAPTPETIDVFLAVEFMAAMIISTSLGLLVGLRMQDHMGLRLVAVLAAMFGLHNLVHAYPEPFQQYVPGGWSQMILSSTEANTLLLRGDTIAF